MNYALSKAQSPADAVSYYSTVAEKFHASYRHDANRLERVALWKRFLNTHATGAKTAYDIGCGSGVLACEIASRGIATTAMDGAEGMLKVAKATASERRLHNITFMQKALPISHAEVFDEADLVVMSSVVEYIDSLQDTFGLVSRMLRSKGIYLFTISNQRSLSRKLVRIVYNLTGRPNYFGLIKHFVTVEGITKELSKAGFTVMEADYCGRADKINRLLGAFLPAAYSSNMIVIAAKKNS